jgi:hypothetical protein
MVACWRLPHPEGVSHTSAKGHTIYDQFGYYHPVSSWGPPLEWGPAARAQWIAAQRPVQPVYTYVVQQPAPQPRPLLAVGNLLSIG